MITFQLQPKVESRTQPSRPRTRKTKPRPRTDFLRTDPLEAKDRNARSLGQGHKAQVFSKKKESSHKGTPIFCKNSGDLQKPKKRSWAHGHRPFLTNQKKCCPRAEDRTFSRTYRLEAKDFKTCPRGQRRFRELFHWL